MKSVSREAHGVGSEWIPWRPPAGPRSLGTQGLTRAARAELIVAVNQLSRDGAYRGRPKTFGECKPGPCPWVSCRHHLKLDVDPVTHAVKDNFPGLDVDEMAETCSLRVAAQVSGGGPLPLEKVGAYANVTMERARQLEKEAMTAARRRLNPLFHPNENPTCTKTPNKGQKP